MVIKNTLIRNWHNIPKAFSNDLYYGYYGANIGSNFYRPIQTISYIIDYHFWELDPFGYHLTNIILQIGVSFLAFLLVANLFTNLAIGIAASVLFALHPIHTEAVTYISGRAEMLMGFFVILSLLLFIRSQEKEKKHSFLIYILSLFSFIFALLSKEIAIVFPLIIFGYIFFIEDKKQEEKYYLLKRIWPFFTLALIYMLFRVTYFNFVTLQPIALAKFPWFIRLCVLPKIIFTYLKLLIAPVGLHMSWTLARPKSYSSVLFAVSSLGAIITACFYYLRRPIRNRLAAFMLFWSLVFFIPQSGILPINAFIAEHFIYLSSLSFFLLVAFLLHEFLRKWLFIFSIGAICAFYVLFTGLRNLEWSVPLVFYQNIIKYSPTSFQAYNNLGLEYERMGFYKKAENEYLKALEIKSNILETHSNLASIYYKQKRYADSLKEYLFIEKMPLGNKAGEVENNIGNIYEITGDLQKAILRYNYALKFDPSLKFTHFNLARIYYSKGEVDLALTHMLESLGYVLKDGNLAEGKIIADFFKNPGSVDNAGAFYNNLGIYFAKNNYWQAAVRAFNCALQLSPNYADCYYNLGLVYLGLGEKLKAKHALKQALRINPNHIRAKSLITKK